MLLYCVLYVFSSQYTCRNVTSGLNFVFGNTAQGNRLHQKQEGKKYDETAPKGQQIKQDLP